MADEPLAAQPVGLEPEEEKDISELSQGQLMVRRFMRSKLSVFGGIVIILLYLMVLFAEFIAPYYYDDQFVDAVWTGPTKLHIQGGRVGIYGLTSAVNPETFAYEFTEDPNVF